MFAAHTVEERDHRVSPPSEAGPDQAGPGEAGSEEVVFSGVQPTGRLHVGNYIGALSVWAELQERYRNIFCIVDLHALTIPEAVDPDRLRAKVREYAALYVASGIDPERSTIFVQSHVSAHSELTWLLNCITPVGWLERMTQYKVKSSHQETVGAGLLDYPVLQAADILLYDTDLVPVGDDQRQHIELTRDIAQRFAHLYEPVFTIPEPHIRESGARIMGLDDPTAKMSKSVAEQKAGHAIGLVDDPDAIDRAVRRAVTDPGREISFADSEPGVLNLLTIFQAMSGESREEVEARFEGGGYGDLKSELTELLVERLRPIRERYEELMEHPDELDRLLERGAAEARPVAEATLDRVREAMGCR